MSRKKKFDINKIKREDDIQLLNGYLEAVLEKKERMKSARDMDDIYVMMPGYIVDPVVSLATQQVKRSEEPTTMLALLDINETYISEDVELICKLVDCDVSDGLDTSRIIADVDNYIETLSGSARDVHVRAYCHDIHKLRSEQRGISAKNVKKRKYKFRERVSGLVHEAERESRIIDAMHKHCRSISDIYAWLSRYFVNPAVDLYAAGDSYALSVNARRNWNDILYESVYVARQCGFRDAVDSDIDLNKVLSATYEQCRQKTGYCLLSLYHMACTELGRT